MKHASSRHALTLVEVLIFLVFVAVIAAVLIPQFSTTGHDRRLSETKYSLNRLRWAVADFQRLHDGRAPAPEQLIERFRSAAVIDTAGGDPLPMNYLTDSNRIVTIASPRPTPREVTGRAGWLYNPATGGVWIDHPKYCEE